MNTGKKVIRNNERGIQKVRFIIQMLFVLLCIWIGIEFYNFVLYLKSGGTAAFANRPPGVDGFLPISSFMSFYLFFTTGTIHQAHPAGLFIFFAIVLISIIYGKAFCSWLCPIGFLSELIGDFGKKLFGNNIKVPEWLDYPLRSIKYLLLGFLVYSVLFLMSITAVRAFLDSSYNLAADLKLFYFFADLSRFSIIIISALFLLSIPIRNFWCRYLCPYGALLGIASLISPNKIKRNVNSCIDCGLCSKACPSYIKVDKVKTVFSDECTSCLNCVDVCPVDNTLKLENIITKRKVNKKYVAVGIIVLFMLITGAGMLTGNWQNNVSKNEYLILHQNLNSLGHPTGTDALKKFNEDAIKKKRIKNYKGEINPEEVNGFPDRSSKIRDGY